MLKYAQKFTFTHTHTHTRAYIERVREEEGGARGVMVIVVVTRVQILDETDYISHSTNTLGKGMNPIILPPAMGK